MLNDKELDIVTGGGDMQFAMINLQSLVSARSTMLTLITNMMQSTGDAAKTIASNCK
jgi:hypothetical protein